MKESTPIFFSICIALILIVSPTVAIQTDGFDWCYQQDVFFWNASSDLSGMRVLDHIPEISPQYTITSTSFSSSSNEITLGTWILPSGSTGTTTIAPGLWRFRTYAKASTDSGTTSIKFRVFNQTSGGTRTYLFFGNAITKDISAGSVPSEYLTSYARRNYTTLFDGDRLGIQVNLSTDSPATRTVSMDVAGNTNASMVTIGYWLCDDEKVNDSYDTGIAGILFGIAGGIIGAIAIIRRMKLK